MNWKVVAVSAGIAFILSLISGLIGRISALGLLFRAVIGAVAFGGVIAGLMILLERYLPELADVLFHGGSPAEPEEESGGLNIVLPEDDIPADLYQRTDAEENDDGIALEVDELTTEDSGTGPAEIKDDGGTIGSADILDSLDSLPDLDAFTGSFVSVEPIKNEQTIKQSQSPSNAESFDPETLARAVQTLLKKDREGK